MIPNLDTLKAAHKCIEQYIHKTPVMTSAYVDALTGATAFFKCENFQKVGAFKARGGFNTILSLSKDERKRGVTAHSSGNHAQAVALAAKTLNIPAYIVMPANAPKVKKAAVEGYGAEVITCEPTLEAREASVEKIIKDKGTILIHPFNDYRIIAGQGTAAIELIEQTDGLDYIFTPVGGGGLVSGTALAAKYLSPKTKVIGCEPEEADDAFRSFNSGKLLPHKRAPKTISDGLLATLGDKTFEIIQQELHDVLVVSEAEIITAMKIIWERMKIVVEPSSAVPLAALIRNRGNFKGRKVGIILSGGNVDLGKLPF